MGTNNTISKDIILLVKETLFDMCDITTVIVYGSAVLNRMRPDSDIDVAIAGKTLFSWDRIQEIRLALSKKIHREIDIIDLHQSHGLILYEALTKGKVVIAKEKRQIAKFMTDVVYFAADMLPGIRMAKREKVLRFITSHSSAG